MHYPLEDFGGDGPVIHIAPANGFPLATYRPIVESLTRTHRVVAIPPRGLWKDAGEPPTTPGSWESVGEDIARGLEANGLRNVIALGHSFGGIASLIAAVRHRPLVRALCLLDPTILSADTMARFRAGKASGWVTYEHPFAGAARARRARFTGRSEAFELWRTKPLFAGWPDEALERYVEGMLEPGPDGDYVLSWPPAWEAYYYESFYPETWTEVGLLDPSLPILVIAGGTTDAFVPSEQRRFAERVPWARMAVIPGHGHLFPQSAPRETARLIEDWLLDFRVRG